ncbi:enoyl-CoA hydratase-related protein [Pararhodospirillum photometricum]|uniref:Enoyl-CoA hydratase n=1 Tax=Pararhodospirillum photometricum DSM 122 TaxID=1150469 RepID=H6SMA7_PARPM|nr:enoyl-CoA hydratase-related protein [Pararhodospirillum photometricum]CCG06790.1 Enoyl-CoA hydratase [Pararhodospirillum photometricum DSM 122]
MTVVLEHLDERGIVRLTLNRPEVRNAFDEHVIAALDAAVTRWGADPTTRVIVLAGAGPAFCAGADLTWMQRMAAYSPEENVADALALARLMRTLDRCPRPTVALVHGPVFGGGVGLVAACDIALAREDALFSLSEVRLGLVPGAISPYVARAIGLRACRRLFLTGERFDASRALALGLVSAVVPDLDSAAADLIAALLQGSPEAQAASKALLHTLEGRRPGDDALMLETAQRIADARASTDGREGVSAFLAKRPPAWRP